MFGTAVIAKKTAEMKANTETGFFVAFVRTRINILKPTLELYLKVYRFRASLLNVRHKGPLVPDV